LHPEIIVILTSNINQNLVHHFIVYSMKSGVVTSSCPSRKKLITYHPEKIRHWFANGSAVVDNVAM
jgi:heterodisulfide reductase subunit C